MNIIDAQSALRVLGRVLLYRILKLCTFNVFLSIALPVEMPICVSFGVGLQGVTLLTLL